MSASGPSGPLVLIFGFLFHKKSYRVLFIVSYISTFGFGRDVKRRLNIGITRVLITVIFPIGDKLRLFHCFSIFSICVTFGI